MRHSALIALAVAAAAPSVATAAESKPKHKPEYVVDQVGEESPDRPPDGVDWRLDAGLTFTFSDNRDVVGQTDGMTLVMGYKTSGDLDLRHEQHELRNLFTFAAGLSRTPPVNKLEKSRDEGIFESIYLFHLIDWFGPFARVSAETAAFPGVDSRAERTTYVIAHADGTTETQRLRRLPLTESFRPSRLKQSVGAFVQPVTRNSVRVEIRAGLGARETFAADQLAVDDDDSTEDIIEVTELRDMQQLGGEGVLEIWGELADKKASYRTGIEVLTPFVHNELAPDDDRGVLDLTNITIRAALSLRIVEWASLDYELGVVREPQLLDQWQLRNHLLINFGITTGNKKPPKKK